MKKSIIYLFSLVMLLVTLAGCGTKGDSDVSSELSVTSEPTSTTTSLPPIVITDLDLLSNREKIAEAMLDLVAFGNWDVENKNALLSTFDQTILIGDEELSLIAALIDVLEKSGITQNELNKLYDIASDIGALIAEINDEFSEGYIEVTKIYLEEKITKVINLITRFENSISERKIGIFVVTLIKTACEAGLISIPEEVSLPSNNEAAILIEFIFDIIDAIKKQGASKIAGLIIFIRDIAQEDIYELLEGSVYSYREMIEYINDFGVMLVDIANAMIPHSNTVENIVTKLFDDVISVLTTDDTIWQTLSTFKDTSVMIKFVGIILRDLTEQDLSNFYMDIDAIAKYNGPQGEVEDKINVTPIARAAKIFISAFDKMSTSEKNSLKNLINSFFNTFIEAFDPDIYDVTLLLTLNVENIINDIRRISSYNPDVLTSQQVQDIKSILFGYAEKLVVEEKPGYFYRNFGKKFVYEGYTIESIKSDFNVYLSQSTSLVYVQSIEILSSSSTELKLKVYYYSYGSDYWSINYLSVVSNPTTSSIPLTLDLVRQNTTKTWYVFTPETSGYYTIHSFDAINNDPCVELYDSSLMFLAADDDAGGNSNFELTYFLIAGETYYYFATEYNSSSTANYKIVLESYFSSSARILPNVTIQVSSESLYEFIPQVSGYYVIYSFNNTGDPFVYIYNSLLAIIDMDDDGGDGYNFRLSYYFLAGQAYYIKATSYGSSSVTNYQMRVESVY